MLGGGAAAGADHRPDDQRGRRLAAEHIAELGGLVEDLVETDAEKIAEHQLGDRPQAGDRGAGGGAHDRGFGDRRVDHPVLAERLLQPPGGTEHAAQDADVLAQQHDPLVLGHQVVEGLANRVQDGALDAALRRGYLLLATRAVNPQESEEEEAPRPRYRRSQGKRKNSRYYL